jgi:hypothetical protein
VQQLQGFVQVDIPGQIDRLKVEFHGNFEHYDVRIGTQLSTTIIIVRTNAFGRLRDLHNEFMLIDGPFCASQVQSDRRFPLYFWFTNQIRDEDSVIDFAITV